MKSCKLNSASKMCKPYFCQIEKKTFLKVMFGLFFFFVFCEFFFMVTVKKKKKQGYVFLTCLTKQKVMEYEMWNITILYTYLYNHLQ